MALVGSMTIAQQTRSPAAHQALMPRIHYKRVTIEGVAQSNSLTVGAPKGPVAREDTPKLPLGRATRGSRTCSARILL
jgi:hypothetical protein